MAKGSHLALDIFGCTKRSGEKGTERSEVDGKKQAGEEDPNESEDGNKWTGFVAFQWIVLVCFVGLLIATLTVAELKIQVIWGLELWKWCVLVLVIFCSGLFSYWMMTFAVFAASGKHFDYVKVMYFVYGLRKSVQLLVWFGLVLVAWSLLFDVQVTRSEKTMRILKGITRGFAASLLGAILWFLKSLLVKFVGSKYQGNRFFRKIKKAILRKHILQVLARHKNTVGKACLWSTTTMSGFVNVTTSIRGSTLFLKVATDNKRSESWIINEFDSIWKALVRVSRGSSPFCETKRITNRTLAKEIARDIFQKLPKKEFKPKEKSQTQESPDSDKQMPEEKNQAQISEDTSIDDKRISEEKNQTQISEDTIIKGIGKEDFLRFFHDTKEIDKEDVLDGLFKKTTKEYDGVEVITGEKFEQWLANVYDECISLPKTLKDNNTGIEELNRVLSGIVLVVIIIVWLLVMGFLSSKALLYISAQLLAASFVFKNTVKTVFEAMVFVFVAHPIDVDDQCIIEDQKVSVREINLLTTIFLNQKNELIYYPNSVLATKPITNIYQSQKYYRLRDNVSFSVDASTTAEQINNLEEMIKSVMDKEAMFKELKMVVEDIEDKDKIEICLYFVYTQKIENHADKKSRRSKFVMKLKAILEQLQIKDDSLPQDQSGKP